MYALLAQGTELDPSKVCICGSSNLSRGALKFNNDMPD